MLKNIFSNYKHSLFEVDSKNLTKASKVSLFFFIVIIFIIIGSGINMQRDYVSYPSKDFGHTCISTITKDKEIDKFQNRDISHDVYSSYFPNHYWMLSDFKYDHYRNSEYQILRKYGKNDACKKLGELYLDIANASAFKDRLLEYNALNESLSTVKKSILRKENEYSNMLLEDIANQNSDLSILSDSSKEVKKSLHSLRSQTTKIDNRLVTLDDLSSLISFTTFKTYIKTNGENILQEHKKARKYYKFQYTLNVFLFLLPTWFLFYLGYRLFKAKQRHILAHLSVHVANVTAFYIIFYLLSLIYEIIPKVFLPKLIKLFSEYNLTILINIFAILIFMAIFGLFIFRIQKNRSQELSDGSVLHKQRVKKGDCSHCGKTNKETDIYCGDCGYHLKKECSACHQLTQVDDTFCRSCGESTSQALS